MPFHIKTDHYKKTQDKRPDIQNEITEAKKKKYPLLVLQTALKFPPVEEFIFLRADNICPSMLNYCASNGIFPMTVRFQGDPIFALKLHTTRSVTFLDSSVTTKSVRSKRTEALTYGIFDERNISVNKKLLKVANDQFRTGCFRVFMNRKEDLFDTFKLVREQHGEDWMCHLLRLCYFNMFFHENSYEMKVIVTAIRRHAYSSSPQASADRNEIREGGLVACEIGYLVGDIYTSATGGYCLNGAGLLQLRLTAHIMKECGCKVWDLGMEMDYKSEHLCTAPIPREEWLTLVQERRGDVGNNILRKLKHLYGEGVDVRTLIQRS